MSSMDSASIQDDLIRELMMYIASPEFQSSFEAFFLENALTFTDDEEHRLEYTTIFHKFQALFEGFMQQFYDNHNITEAEFGKRCRAAVKTDEKASQYLDVVLASMDYQAFYNLMKFMRKRAAIENKGKRKHESKEVDAKESKSHGKDDAKATEREDDDEEKAQAKRK
ncbi:hypothetical protein THRCLA_08385 [Thraustotheca clavata]|uniref:Cilia- and flagella-associated protein 36 n=1 Tax=Thraustotheca clavata TaxID=74557 RepID=A0A1V9Z6Q5_9STRA|nr:hypothetical protein THRCLA_08385 [Thraustotheca clavata]